MNTDLKKIFKKNIKYAAIGYIVNLIFSLLMTLIMPKILGVQQFAYWQLFIFYTSYVGLFHLGLSDGVYLRYGGMDVDEINCRLIDNQFKLLLAILVCISIGITFIGSLKICEIDRVYVLFYAGVYLVFANVEWFWGYVYQALNHTNIYSISVIFSKCFFFILTFILVCIKQNTYKMLISSYIISVMLSCAYLLYKRNIFSVSQPISRNTVLREYGVNVRTGISLTISNTVSKLIIGSCRFFVDVEYGVITFSMFSLAITVTNFVIQFITQISMVVFPILKKLQGNVVKEIYIMLCETISCILCGLLCCFFPLRFFLEYWIPEYSVAVEFLEVLFPICIFEGKMYLIYNTYLKVFRKERGLLILNLITVVLSIVLSYIGVKTFKQVIVVVVCLVIVIMVKSLMANIYLSKIMKTKYDRTIWMEIILSSCFIILNTCTKNIVGCISYSILVSIYIICCKDSLKNSYRKIVKIKY